MWTWKRRGKKRSSRSLTPITKKQESVPRLQPKVCVCWTFLLPDTDIAVKHLQKMPLSALLQRDFDLARTDLTLQPRLSHHQQLSDSSRQPNANQNQLQTLGETRQPRAENLVFQINKPTLGHSVLQIGSSCCCHITDIATNGLFSTKSCNSQTCEFNQVHRRLWLETHAAFLSYDLITRLFSSTVEDGEGEGGSGLGDCTSQLGLRTFYQVSGVPLRLALNPLRLWWHRWRSW